MTYKQLIGECERYFQDDPDASGKLEKIKANRRDDKCEVVLAGGVSRGKSRLLNQLLHSDILPESNLPTTTVLTEVSYGDIPTIELQTEAGIKHLPVSSTSLECFSAEESGADTAGIIRIQWPAPFLKPLLAIYDTPGIDDILGYRANITYDLLERAEGAVIVISATNPLSILEHNFIETYLKGHSIPKIAVAISFLDIVPEKEVAKSVQYIVNKAHRIDPALEVWAMQALGEATRACTVAGTDAIAQRLHQWSEDPRLEELRDRRDISLLREMLQKSMAKKAQLLTLLERQSSEGQKALLSAYERLDHQKDNWEDMRKKFLDRAEHSRKALLEELNGFKQHLLDCLATEQPDEFNYRLRSRLTEQTGNLSDKIRSRVWEDASGLQKDIAKQFALPNGIDLAPRNHFGLAYSVPVLARDDGGGVIGVLLQFAKKLWSDAGEILPIPGGYYKQVYNMGKSMLERLSQQYGASDDFVKETTEIINAFFTELQLQIKLAIETLYAETADHIREEQARWLREQRDTLMETHTPAQLNEKIDACRKSIATGQELLARLG